MALAVACSSSSSNDGPSACAGAALETGGDGHADPFGAKAAGQARAGKIRDASQIVAPANARNRPRVGDFVIANDKVTAYIGGAARADGYIPFGGKLMSVETVGADGRPRGVSQYGESLFMFSRQTIAPDSVTVMNDGSDGKAAIVRASGKLANVPFIDLFKSIFPEEYGFPAAFDYVLEPGAETIHLRVTLANTRSENVDLTGNTNLGFFHDYRSPVFTAEQGYATPKGDAQFVAFDSDASFLIKIPNAKLTVGIGVSGFQLFTAPGPTIPSCATQTLDYADITVGSPGIDGLLEAKRRAAGEAAWKEVKGDVHEAGGGAIAGAFVHATAADGSYLSRATTGADGTFTIHVPDGASLTATAAGYPVGTASSGPSLELPKHGTISVIAHDMTSNDVIPARVQVIPQQPLTAPPASWGVPDEANGRLHQAFTTTGSVDLAVPAGAHRVVVTRGYEYELSDTTVTVASGATSSVDAKLLHSVDSTGIMCADFHIHTHLSVDAGDTVADKVKSAIADGLDIPVSSDHEWIDDFQPIIQTLGLTKFAYGFPSEELTTFAYGHFGVVPITPHPELPNMGAVDWIGKEPPQLFHEVVTRPEAPVLIVNHPSKGDFQSYFSAAGLDRASAKGTAEKWSEEFTAIEVFNDSDLDANRSQSVADWFALLNAGKTYFAVGNSDSHHIRTSPVGYPRNCMTFGHDDPTKLSAEIVRDALKTGASTISGGLLMDVTGPGGAKPGATAAAGSYAVSVQAPSWLDATKLEVIVDGVSTQTVDLVLQAGTRKYTATVDVQVPGGSVARGKHWVVFHAKGSKDLAPLHPGRNPFAVSNPIFF